MKRTLCAILCALLLSGTATVSASAVDVSALLANPAVLAQARTLLAAVDLTDAATVAAICAQFGIDEATLLSLAADIAASVPAEEVIAEEPVDPAETAEEAAVELIEETVVVEEAVSAPLIPILPLADGTETLILGDSNARGYGLDAAYDFTGAETALVPVEGTLAGAAAKAMGKYGDAAAVLAGDGATLEDVLAVLTDEKAAEYFADVDNYVINAGGNDLLHLLYSLIPAGTELTSMEQAITGLDTAALTAAFTAVGEQAVTIVTARMEAVIDAIRTINPKAYIVFATVPGVTSAYAASEIEAVAAIGALGAQIVEQVNKAMAETAHAKDTYLGGTYTFDVNTVSPAFQADGIHFTAETHTAAGEAMGKYFAGEIDLDAANMPVFRLYNVIRRTAG
ncbi:MAG: SGNH/GDSL hydrolase family protein [Clostridia bacterium]|nr:SGNH/GDSL hydrolase family protein [Clostridia bacterium]